MKEENHILSHDGIGLRYAVQKVDNHRPWIALVIPFGLKLEQAKNFFDFFGGHYNIVTWESRSILEDSDRGVAEGEFAIDNHVADLHAVLTACGAARYSLVGYCSGAGVGLAAANRHPELFDKLILVHGEYVLLEHEECTTQFAMEIDRLLSMAARDEKHLSLVFAKINEERLENREGRPEGIDLPFTKLTYLRRYAANYLEYKSTDFTRLAGTVTHDCLLMSGGRDAQANIESTRTIARLMSKGEVRIDPHGDHYGILRVGSRTHVTIWNYLCERRAAA